MKVNFSKIIIKDIEGRDIEECELGKRIYFADGEMELSEKECAIVRNAVQGYSYIARTAIENQIKKT